MPYQIYFGSTQELVSVPTWVGTGGLDTLLIGKALCQTGYKHQSGIQRHGHSRVGVENIEFCCALNWRNVMARFFAVRG
ncbi:MAG: hypothetical protein NHB32_25280 [Fischerella sp. CENA71]|nr:hypothetical protein [Fischerella sp. CENA71]